MCDCHNDRLQEKPPESDIRPSAGHTKRGETSEVTVTRAVAPHLHHIVEKHNEDVHTAQAPHLLSDLDIRPIPRKILCYHQRAQQRRSVQSALHP